METFSNPIVLASSERMHDTATRILNALNNKHCSYVPVALGQFPNGEIKVKITESVRSKDVYVLHGFHPDPNKGLMELFLMNNAIKLASAKSIIPLLPCMPYTRQDRKDKPRVPISFREIANLIESCSAVRRIITTDLHVEQEVGFYDIPVENIPAGRILHADYFLDRFNGNVENIAIIAPDLNSAPRAKRFAERLGDGIQLGILWKEREDAGVKMLDYIGRSIVGKDVIIYDDMADTMGTMIKAIELSRKMGAKSVQAAVTHAFFSPTEDSTAEEKIQKAGVNVVALETICRDEAYYTKHISWLTSIRIDRLLAKVIEASETQNGSISTLFDLKTP